MEEKEAKEDMRKGGKLRKCERVNKIRKILKGRMHWL